MKKHFWRASAAMLLCGAVLCGTMTSCKKTSISADGMHGADLTDTALDAHNKASLSAPIPLSGFRDVTDEDGICKYSMVAELTDTYTFTCEKATALRVQTENAFEEGETSVTVEVKAGERVAVEVTAEKKSICEVTVKGKTYEKRLPYLPNFTVDASKLDLYGDNTKVPAATTISYTKRKGGTYVYLNNPEKLQREDYGAAILRNRDLSGDVQVTWEHSNYTGKNIFLGYQLKNDGKTDVYVTVTNIGLQVEGEWLGQRSWSDYYNRAFTLPADYFEADGETVSERYLGQDFINYTPRVFQPITYRIPAGQYIYVLGGTSGDAFQNINVGNTANRMIGRGRCSNGVAKFFVTGGAVTGTLYCYGTADQVQAEPEQQGFILERRGEQYGYQYKGVDYHTALIESNPVFIVNNHTESGSLPVTYTNEYDEYLRDPAREPYMLYNSTSHTVEGHSWRTNINQQSSRKAVGTDMSSFECVTTDGKTVVIDNMRSDGTRKPANLGNWMIDYHDNMTFVNQGDLPRTFTINKAADGALMAMVMDPNGKVLATKCTIEPIEDSPTVLQWEIYEFELAPHSSIQLSVSFLLMGNSNGNVSHWIRVE